MKEDWFCRPQFDADGKPTKISTLFRHSKNFEMNFYECPMKFVTPLTAFLLKLYYKYQQGILAFSGGAAEQPAYIDEAFDIITEAMLEAKECK